MNTAYRGFTMLTGGDGRKRKWPLKNKSHDRKKKWPIEKTVTWQERTEALKTTDVTEEFSLRIVICLVKERSLENACMAFCTWNKALKGNTRASLLRASSVDSRLVFLFILLFCYRVWSPHSSYKNTTTKKSNTETAPEACLVGHAPAGTALINMSCSRAFH